MLFLLVKRTKRLFNCACAEAAVLKLPVKNLTLPFAPATSISYKDGYFSTIGWRFRHIFDVFVHNFHLTLWPWPFDLGGVWRIKSLIRPTHLPILSFLRLSVPQLCGSIWSHYHHLEWSLRMRRVTWPITGEQKWSTFLKSLTPICLFALSLSGSYDEV